MQLKHVLEGVPLTRSAPAASPDADVRGLAYDSRKVETGYLFFAFAGAKTDGAQFANAAMQKGAVAVVSERPKPGGFSGPWLQVPHGREALAVAARNFYYRPDETIALTGVTGTNGKTTSTLLIDSVLRAAGKITALIGRSLPHVL
jgi:UDP-N-acetylmuramoyl-L-alanyl-D-glutamate--2,6-diaminopimelate ligase